MNELYNGPIIGFCSGTILFVIARFILLRCRRHQNKEHPMVLRAQIQNSLINKKRNPL